MESVHAPPFRLAARALSAGVVSLALTLTACTSNETGGQTTTSGLSTSQGQSSSPAVQASNVTKTQPQDQQGHYTLAFPTGDRNSSSLLIEQVGPKQVHVNRPATYQIKVTNLTDAPVRGIVLRSQHNDGFQLTSASGATTQPSSNGQVAYQVGDLGPKQSKTIEIRGVPERPGTIDNCYAVSYQPPTLCTAMVAVNPALRVAVEGPTSVDICQDITYRYTVTNTGTGTAHNVVLKDTLPEGLTTTDGKNAVSANLGDIPQGQTRDVTAHLKAARTGRFATQALAQSQYDTAKSQQFAMAVHAPALQVAIKGPDQDYVGKQVTYQVSVTNKGDAPARDAMLRINNSSDIGQIVAINPSGSNAGEAQLASGRMTGNSAANLGTLAPGETRTMDVVAQGKQGGVMSINADASAQCAQRVTQSAQTRFMTVPSLLLETVDETDPVRIGDTVVYDVKVTNQGTGADTNVRVSATIPDGEQFVSAHGATDATVDGQNITFAPIPTLGPKQSATWKVTVKAVRPGDVQFRTTARSDEIKAPAMKAEPTKLY